MLRYPVNISRQIISDEIALADLDYYNTQWPDGNSMYWSMFTIGYADLGNQSRTDFFFTKSAAQNIFGTRADIPSIVKQIRFSSSQCIDSCTILTADADALGLLDDQDRSAFGQRRRVVVAAPIFSRGQGSTCSRFGQDMAVCGSAMTRCR